MNFFSLHCGHHNSNGTYIENGEIVFFTESERISKIKYDPNPLPIIKHLAKYTNYVDIVCVLHCRDVQIIIDYLEKEGVKVGVITNENNLHHFAHACTAFYTSDFDEALALICDGRGSGFTTGEGQKLYETTSIYEFHKKEEPALLYKRFTEDKQVGTYFENSLTGVNYITEVCSEIDVGGMYQAVAKNQGFSPLECGKTMGLAAYGKQNNLIPPFLGEDVRANANIFQNDNSINTQRYPILKADLKSSIQADISYAIQKAAEEMILAKMKKAMKLSKTRNFVVSGGVFQNVLINSRIKNQFPSINLHVDPYPTDGGLSLGVALDWAHKQNINMRPKTTYLGKKYEYSKKQNTKASEVAELIQEGKIGALYQGRSESGCRALGNRSLLFNPSLPNGKEIINAIKKREWFRPFAATVLDEKAEEWFYGSKSPFMTYAKICKRPKDISAVVHEDNTCRVQTLTKSQNLIFWEIINEFYKLSEVPVVGNTSFNINGQPIVETKKDAMDAYKSMSLDFIYLADEDKLITQ